MMQLTEICIITRQLALVNGSQDERLNGKGTLDIHYKKLILEKLLFGF